MRVVRAHVLQIWQSELAQRSPCDAKRAQAFLSRNGCVVQGVFLVVTSSWGTTGMVRGNQYLQLRCLSRCSSRREVPDNWYRDSKWSFADHPPLWLLALTCRITWAATPHSVLPSRSGVQASSTWCMRRREREPGQAKRSKGSPARLMPDRRCRVMPFAASGKTQ
jgi:hypothetical protein